MPRHKRGTLVRVKTPEENDRWDDDDVKSVVGAHGWLFTVIRYQTERHPNNDTGEAEYLCRSLASGEEVSLYPREITTRQRKGVTDE